ncbi:hypothetical protein LINPERPRIM_LOCUS34381 [Linum perenne]
MTMILHNSLPGVPGSEAAEPSVSRRGDLDGLVGNRLSQPRAAEVSAADQNSKSEPLFYPTLLISPYTCTLIDCRELRCLW